VEIGHFPQDQQHPAQVADAQHMLAVNQAVIPWGGSGGGLRR
jgi:hypothetical protein